ncbi:LuxR C-terminal-related transcriptional regulator [Candidatus Chloroploca sp. Khr17]|uniref:LuxR C-terminal-related transcriptional regulator n=1 Tax=Candidatus Chloroploca sp. Khr17 TaxID=2496869 RepID=UPI00101CA2E9|nr:LuxR C-terminal-related transcriptional regulator [Candidatus Chloroploca sp. Khr17]
MLAPVITTKLLIPPLRLGAIARPGLIARLDAGLQRPFTLISAPAGFGKTTLLSNWLADCRRPVAWLSLDADDSDPMRLLAHLVAALQTIAPTWGAGLRELLQSPQPPTLAAMTPTLVNDLAAVSEPYMLVLDDYHLVEATAVDRLFATLLDQPPPQLHLVVVTREDPPLPLARLRARGQLSELRAADLRFTPAEAAAFLSQVMGLSLTADVIAALEQRTEGWIAGLQLAALSLQGHTDPAGFVAAFGGSHRFVLDYLLEEVLHRQPAPIQEFLLQTAILDRLCGPLCDALLARPDGAGQVALEAIERANLFLIPLDHERRWYRYHHLFRDLLQTRLQQSAPATIHDLHRRASVWYEANDFAREAFEHAAATGDLDRAANLIAGEGLPLHFRSIVQPVLRWLATLPRATLDARPALWVTYASAATMRGEPEASVEAKLQAAEAALLGGAPDDTTRDLHGQIAAIRAMLAVPKGHAETIIAQSRCALELLRPDNLSLRTTTTWTLGLAYQLQGERAAAARAFADAITASQVSGNTMITIAATTCLGQIQESQNQLDSALGAYRHVLTLAGDPSPPFTCEAVLGMARISYAWNDLDAAERHGQQSLALARQLPNVDTPVSCLILLAQVRLAWGDPAGADELLEEAVQIVREGGFLHRMTGIAEVQVQTLLRQGRLDAAAQLAQAHEHPLALARVNLAREAPSAALALLEPLHRQAEAQNWPDQQLKAALLQALAHAARGDAKQALALLDEGLALAKPGRLVRLFVDEGAPMAQLLAAVAARGSQRDAAATLLAAFPAVEAPPDGGAVSPQPLLAQPLAEPLSPREIQILRMIAQGRSNFEISEQLALAESTVKGYNRNLFDKLQVRRRTEAVARARELGLL